MKDSNGLIEKSNFVNNKATIFSKNIFVFASKLTVKLSEFSLSKKSSPISEAQKSLNVGAFFFVSLGVEITIDSCTFKNGIAE